MTNHNWNHSFNFCRDRGKANSHEKPEQTHRGKAGVTLKQPPCTRLPILLGGVKRGDTTNRLLLWGLTPIPSPRSFMVLMLPSTTLTYTSSPSTSLAEAELSMSQHPTVTDPARFLCNCGLLGRLSSCWERQEFFWAGSVGLREQTSSISLVTRFDTALNSSFSQDRAKATERQPCKGTDCQKNWGGSVCRSTWFWTLVLQML